MIKPGIVPSGVGIEQAGPCFLVFNGVYTVIRTLKNEKP